MKRLGKARNEPTCAKFALLCLSALTLSACLKTSNNSATSSALSGLPSCSLNQSSTTACAVGAAGFYVTATAGNNITSWTNATLSTTVTGSITNGFYSGQTCSFTDPMLLPSSIQAGATIFGVVGTAAALSSTANRTQNTTQLTSSAETVTYIGLPLPTTGGYSYREIPKIALDDEAGTLTTITAVNRSSPVNWIGRTCGTNGTTNQRVADCAVQLGTEATWNGSVKGHSGEGKWKIVTRTGECSFGAPNRQCQEVWRDERTQMLWSSRISESINWCMAAGSNNIPGNSFAESDPSSYCDNSSYQNTSGLAISACHEDGTVNFTTTNAAINNNGKAGLGLTSTQPVIWRLPTLSDYALADLDGIRFVMPDMGSLGAGATVSVEWTSTTLSTNHANAWAFDFYLGSRTNGARNNPSFPGATTVGSRCVGR